MVKLRVFTAVFTLRKKSAIFMFSSIIKTHKYELKLFIIKTWRSLSI